MLKRIPPSEATCCSCMKRKRSVLKRETFYAITEYDNFFYSEIHRGWICKRCKTKLDKDAGKISAENPFEFLRAPGENR